MIRLIPINGVKKLLIAAAGLWLATGLTWATEVSWEDLPDASVQEYDDPYRDLTYDQIDSLRTIAQLRERLNGPASPGLANGDLTNQLTKALQEWKTAGIDPDWLIDQRWVVAERRKQAATAGNPALDGTEATLSGFVIPAPPDADGQFTAYLVPERGMCSHMPPPPPNQLLRLVFDEAWYPRFIYEPIKVSGLLGIAPTQRSIRVVDGPVVMASTFSLEVASLDSLRAQSGTATERQPWPLRPHWQGGQAGTGRP
ncbi:DUF3299 domain-containing protein [Labrenzia sp. PHM005]|uniref:DUF3299 domain-containing protein n=1 Tax=Labrenzia sp. PHM005 TaxID=2590016 RepID=UPI001140858B|nr:DUF3299 domain-containing protein [Labrenzia sp. PHM005]QDG78323.1 DUF3299 domain-containing protein [Labrenzia sp. PHM005]